MFFHYRRPRLRRWGSYGSWTPVGAEGEQVDVRCALVGPAENYTKRKHVLRVNTLAGSELLLQAADAGQMARWIEALEEQANNNNSQNLSGTSLSPASAQKGLRKLTSLRNRSPTGQSPVNKTRKPSQQVVEGVPSPKSKTWKGRVAKQLRRIQHSGSPVSPTATTPHPEGATIGVPLEECPPSAINEFVPLLVEMCTGIVEARGLEIIGIYRVPGNTAAVSSLTEAVNRGLEPGILAQDQRWTDVNVISSLLKSFFRRLPDCLLTTTELYPSFIRADKIADPHLRMATIRRLVHDLPDHHYETLKYLLLHLKKVVEHAATNKMEARNLAIVFGPTLVRAADDNMVTMVTDMSHQCRIVETLILHVDWCFGDETVERLTLEGVEGGGVEPDPAVANHNLLLGNIHKVEGMGRELSARDIVSSIICAANRKMMKSKTRKTHAEDNTDHSAESKQRLEMKSKQQHRKERLASTEDASSTEAGHPGGLPAASLPAAPQPTSLPDNVAASEEQAVRPQLDDGTIRTYAGLSATTQERIRRFELETKAMLHRDSARIRRLEPDSEREQSKRELEMDDHTNPSAIVKKIAESGRPVKPLAIVPPSTGRGRHKEEGGAGALRRGSSAENVNLPTEKQANGNLKRFKSGKEQGEPGLGRCGSLDSLHDLTTVRATAQPCGDLLVSLTSTFDAKLRSLLSTGATERTPSPAPSHHLFSDPSLHKASDKEGKEEESKEECCDEKDKSNSTNLLTQTAEALKDMDGETKTVRLNRSESMNRDERTVFRSESLKSDSGKLRRSESLNKEKLKRSDSLTKNEKTESNLNKRRQLEAGRWLKRKTGSAVDRSIKRRHTVGGTKDFDKTNWLDNRQREAEEEGKKERRTSSPDLSSSRLAAIVILRPHSFAEPERLCGVPLESHV
ncbi:LOW QUALITY PROTEIN: rho GTPase-activating protein 23-like [Homalodisca vitripennis]|uniref:LOW QUALITY PROTEIN: rho GTPase-activating protein 23-like n=1 Tax=Homalodisca vitripennis TaxID=197043 RepID=UPI001EEC4077|nr:LOW QUALITY PROTEIN: rho GTPase-activating protein 23-like [Homalodisca vitripennis]